MLIGIDLDFWLKDEWLFFLNDIYNNQLNDNGTLYLGFNSEIDNKFYLGNDILHDMFDPYIENRTAVLNKNDIRKIITDVIYSKSQDSSLYMAYILISMIPASIVGFFF